MRQRKIWKEDGLDKLGMSPAVISGLCTDLQMARRMYL